MRWSPTCIVAESRMPTILNLCRIKAAWLWCSFAGGFIVKSHVPSRVCTFLLLHCWSRITLLLLHCCKLHIGVVALLKLHCCWQLGFWRLISRPKSRQFDLLSGQNDPTNNLLPFQTHYLDKTIKKCGKNCETACAQLWQYICPCPNVATM